MIVLRLKIALKYPLINRKNAFTYTYMWLLQLLPNTYINSNYYHWPWKYWLIETLKVNRFIESFIPIRENKS